MLAMFPPLTSNPPHVAGNPIRSAIHVTVCASISVATGDSVRAPTFGLTAAASRSPSIPIGEALDVMYPKNRGCPLNSDWSKSSAVASRSSASGSEASS